MTSTEGTSPQSIEIDGVRWAYTEQGSGPLVLFLHGTLSSSAMFDALVDSLADRYHCIAVDWPGHGHSGYDPDGWTSDDLVESLVRFLDALGEPSAAFVGLSQGGAVSLRVALRHPEVVDALVTMNAGPDGPAAPALEAMAELGRVLRSAGDDERLEIATRQQQMFHADGWVDANPEAAQRELEVMLGHDRDAMPLVVRVPASYSSVETQLPDIECRTLVLWGEEDVRAFWGPPMAEAIPHARLEIIAGAGHHMTFDAPASTARAVGEFLDDVFATGAGR
ncbi:alpha/beta fold hydrolase [Rhodococcus artemisiae]|uniref:Alpha/beta hydrolase n=1 Tax=Rhodococcus artemisiae TaxID=714159 RepID=A0ABU7L959_9NOCA|nr:alpha/beta hydrolase [Rhodococcus artemisiae]MEE2058069.1 alpha/beta hydrolase [Rhodococcus artemisiae]